MTVILEGFERWKQRTAEERAENLRSWVAALPEWRASLAELAPKIGDRERRIVDSAFAIETRANSSAKQLVGYASIFGVDSQPMGWTGWTEEVQQGAFKDSVGVDDIRALFNHDPNLVLGRTKEANTLQLSEDSKGLRYVIDLPDTQTARDLAENVRLKNISQSSFGFETITDQWSTKEGAPHRTLIKARLFDVSPVTFPAYTDTEVGARSEMRCASALVKLQKGLPLVEDEFAAIYDELRQHHGAVIAMTASERMAANRRRLRLAEAEK